MKSKTSKDEKNEVVIDKNMGRGESHDKCSCSQKSLVTTKPTSSIKKVRTTDKRTQSVVQSSRRAQNQNKDGQRKQKKEVK